MSWSFGGGRTKYRRRNAGYKTRFGNRSYRGRRYNRRRVRRRGRKNTAAWRSLKQVKVTRWRSDSTEFTVPASNMYIWRFDTSFDPNNDQWKGLSVMGKEGYSVIYDEVKLLSTKMFVKLSDPGEVYSGTAAEINDIKLYSTYDPDARQRNYASLRSFLDVEHTKKRNWMDLRKEYCITFHPKWENYQQKQDSTSGLPFRSRIGVTNPWWDIGSFGQAYPEFPMSSTNAKQLCFDAASGVKFKVRYEHVIGYRGVRNGQLYAAPPGPANSP